MPLGKANRATVLTVETQEEIVRGLRSRKQALKRCFDESNLDAKEVYSRLGVDQSQFSKILAGKAFPDPDHYFEIMEICGNEIPARYDAYHLGCELKPLLSSVEEENADLRRQLAEQQREIEIIKRFVSETQR